jgi:putative autoinducer-2 (AI-2) aldolase
MGRNIFQSEAPVAMIKAVRAIVHRRKSAEEAFDLFLNEKPRLR